MLNNERGSWVWEFLSIVTLLVLIASVAGPELLDYLESEKIPKRFGSIAAEFKKEFVNKGGTEVTVEGIESLEPTDKEIALRDASVNNCNITCIG